MKRFRSLLSLVLALALVLGLSALPVWADDSAEDTGYASITNPLYPDLSAHEAAPQALDSLSAPRLRSSGYVSIQEAAAQMRDNMRSRNEAFDLAINIQDYATDITSIKSLVADVLIPAACSEDIAVGVSSGDYLAWSWSRVDFTWTVSTGRLNLSMVFSYYTTQAQEAQLLQAVTQTVQSLKLARASDYQKYLGVYDYITNHVVYDSDALNGGDTSVLTAYSALLQGKAVCQGYATLFYAMCRSLNLPVRIITSSNHAWNIVKLGDQWYSLDSTWDGSAATGTLQYFLKGSKTFTDHTPSDKFLTADFAASYPMAEDDYVPTQADSLPINQFTDIQESDYFYTQVNDIADRGLVNGMTLTTFGPTGTTTRAMLVTVLWRMAGSPEVDTASGFADVAADAYYAKSVAWAQATSVTTGTSATTFSPDELLTREQLATFLYRYAGYMGYDLSAADSLTGFTDAASITGYARSPIAWAVGAGIINGFPDGTVAPQGSALRCQMATMLSRFISYNQL